MTVQDEAHLPSATPPRRPPAPGPTAADPGGPHQAQDDAVRSIPTSRVGHVLLAAAGVDRDVLAEVPEERHRYIGIGGTVVGTAALAAGSVAMLAATVLDVHGWAIAIPALLWGLFVFNLDRWLISSTHGMARRWMLIPRLVLAVLLGIVVAEPVVLWTFRSAIEQEIASQRADALKTTEDALVYCNPTDPTATAERQSQARCQGLALSLTPPPGLVPIVQAMRAELAKAEQASDNLRAQEAALSDRLQRERVGEQGGDTSGERGEGPLSRALEADLADLRSRLSAAEARTQGLESRLQEALGESSENSGTYAEGLQAAIEERLVAEREAFSAEPGLLERLEALGDLTGRHRDLFWARAFLSLFLIALDSMPVFAKAMSGKTTYDGLLHAHLLARERTARNSLTAEGDERAADITLDGFKRDQRRLVSRRQIEVRRDRELLRLDTERTADRNQHGGSDHEIEDALAEVPTGPLLTISWEQPSPERPRRNRFRRFLGPDDHEHRVDDPPADISRDHDDNDFDDEGNDGTIDLRDPRPDAGGHTGMPEWIDQLADDSGPFETADR